MRIFGKIKLWSIVEKGYDVAWTRICKLSTRYKSSARLGIKEKNLASPVLKLSKKNSTWSVNKYYKIVWTTYCTFYKNYKSSDLLQMSLKKISNFYIKDTLKKSRRQLRKKMRIFGKIKFWRTVEKDYDVAWTANCTFSIRFKSFARLRIKENNLASFVLKLSQKNATWSCQILNRAVRYETKKSDIKWVLQV
ncbi:hypothetical protein M0802_013411 [Mischocyttarus mexicanus]|nr:hypothetical protein M0802_013411 [Mischocyttarus mexicanus]